MTAGDLGRRIAARFRKESLAGSWSPIRFHNFESICPPLIIGRVAQWRAGWLAGDNLWTRISKSAFSLSTAAATLRQYGIITADCQRRCVRLLRLLFHPRHLSSLPRTDYASRFLEMAALILVRPHKKDRPLGPYHPTCRPPDLASTPPMRDLNRNTPGFPTQSIPPRS